MADPKKKPTGKVGKLKKPTRASGSTAMTSTWAMPSEHAKGDSRAQTLDIWWTLYLSGGSRLTAKRDGHAVSTKQSVLNIVSFEAGGKTYTRQSFWPYTKTKLLSATVNVREANKVGKGPWVSASLGFKVPAKPEVSSVTLNQSNGRISFTVKTSAGSDSYERVRTAYRTKVYRSWTNVTTVNSIHRNSATQFSDAIDITDWQAIDTKSFIRVVVEAWNEGWAGDSQHTTRPITLAYPAKAQIDRIGCAGTKNDDKVTVYVSTGNQDYHPITLARLEALVNTEYMRAGDIPGDAEWTQIGATDDGKLKAFATTAGDLRPEQGNRTWLRVVTVNMHEPPYSVISAYKYVDKLETELPSAVDDSVVLDEPVPGTDGTSADVRVKWNENTPNTGTELTWSTDDRAWRSTQPPSPFEFTWKTGNGPTGFTGYADVRIPGLAEGVNTYIRARRYYEDQDGDRTYTGYSNMVSVMPVTAPNSVVLSVPPAVPRGEDFEAVWTYDTDSVQTEWQLFEVKGQSPNIKRDKVLDSGTDARGSVVVPSGRLSSDSARVYVSMSTGGKAVQSDPASIEIVDPPTCEVTAATLTAKPMTFGIESNVAGIVTAVVTADGISGDGFGPDQMAGDTVWSAMLRSQEWTEGVDSYTTTVTVPAMESVFYDTGTYHVSARVTDPSTGLVSEVSEATFGVDYSHKAPELTTATEYLADVIVTPSDVTDVQGSRVIGCTISLAEPPSFAQTDVLDLYRVGRDGAQMVAEGLSPDAVVFDPYAPYGGDSLAYRVVSRTSDGDRAWADYPYELHRQGPTDSLSMRIDYAGGYAECERGVAPTDKWSKDFSLFVGMDGSMTGSWGNGIRRDASAQAVFVRAYEESQQASMEELASHIGPCFVRVSDGSAYEADVQVTGRSRSLKSAGVTYSLSITMLDPSGTFAGSEVES